LGSGLIAGFFFAFSICVVKALGALPPSQGIAAMQSINVVVINRWFLTAFFGTAAACLVAVAASLLNWHDPRAAYWLVGAVLYLVASILVTMVFNVPGTMRSPLSRPTVWKAQHCGQAISSPGRTGTTYERSQRCWRPPPSPWRSHVSRRRSTMHQ
jgi:uncharacterized membrane protein